MATRTDDVVRAGRASVDSEQDAPWIENRPSSGWLAPLELPDLWGHRELVRTLAEKEIKVRYKQTLLGVAWVVLQPLAGVLIFTIFFGRLAHLRTDDLPPAVYYVVGLTGWLYVSTSVTAAAQSLVDKRELVTKVYFPRLLAPIAALVPGLLDYAVSIVIVAVFLAAYSVSPGVAVVATPLWALAMVAVALGTGLWLAALNVKYRDVRQVMPFLLQLWLYVSPIAYSASLVHGAWKYVYAVNPMVSVLVGLRWSLADGPAPGAWAFVSLGVTLAVLASGYVYFRRVERFFADVI